MKTAISTLLLLISAIVIMAYSEEKFHDDSRKSASGAQFGYSGDPSGGNKNCTNCHSGPAAQMKTGWITSDIPESGYTPQTTYTITATAQGEGHTRFGFQITPQNSNRSFLGTLVNTSSQTKLTSNTGYITHSPSGISGTGSKSWSFNWTSPAAKSGPVTFYGAFNISNANNSSSGDTIYLSTLTVLENTATGISENEEIQKISVYPNPASEYFSIQTLNNAVGSDYIVYDQSGRQALRGRITDETTTVDIRNLSKGLYFIQLSGKNKEIIKIVKQ